MSARTVASTARKLFSLPRRRTSTWKVPYGSSAPLLAVRSRSAWNCAASSSSDSVRISPTPRPRRAPSSGSLSAAPASSLTATTSAPRTYVTPYRCGKEQSSSPRAVRVAGAPSGARGMPGFSSALVPISGGGRMVTRNTTSCSRRPSHSARTSPRNDARLTVASASTRAGTSSPTRGCPTRSTRKPDSGTAMRDHPAKVVRGALASAYASTHGRSRRTASTRSSRIS
mmetsp:Transcript_21045/g.67859  ORF Transcript_21045/g.67859 Transcript_21045/m.67859 type:complete len:228 (-) Transcript_21045:241-924(-)